MANRAQEVDLFIKGIQKFSDIKKFKNWLDSTVEDFLEELNGSPVRKKVRHSRRNAAKDNNEVEYKSEEGGFFTDGTDSSFTDDLFRRPKRTASKAADLAIKKNLNMPLKLRRPSGEVTLNGTFKTRSTRTKVIKKCKRSEALHLPAVPDGSEPVDQNLNNINEPSTSSGKRTLRVNLVQMRTEQFEKLTKQPKDTSKEQEHEKLECDNLRASDNINNNIVTEQENENIIQHTRCTRTKTRNKNAAMIEMQKMAEEAEKIARKKKEEEAMVKEKEIRRQEESEALKEKKEEEEERAARIREEMLTKKREQEEEEARRKEEAEKERAKKKQKEILAKKKEQEEAKKKRPEAIEKKHREMEAKRAMAAKKREEMILAAAKKKEGEIAAKKKEMALKKNGQAEMIRTPRAEKGRELKENMEPDQSSNAKPQKKLQNPKINKLKNDTYTMTPPRDERPPEKSKTKNDYGIDDCNTDDSSDDESKPKKIVPEWAQSPNIEPVVKLGSQIPVKLVNLLWKTSETDPYKTLGYENIKRPRTSSAVWHSPLLSKSTLSAL